MVRSARDATLFTPTGPYAAAKPQPRATTIPISGPAPTNETPQQKVARLREAARRAKLSQESGTTFDRVVARGRVWADRAHRFTTLGLIGFTAVATVITAVSLGDMMIYNRRKRNDWYAQQQAQREVDLSAAYEAVSKGTANEDQILLIHEEQEIQKAVREKAAKAGVMKRVKDYMFSGLSREEQKGGKLGVAANNSHSSDQGFGITKAVQDSVREHKEMLKSEAAALSPQTSQPSVGGPLDQLGEETAEAVEKSSKSWTSWITGR
ncbi:hypothetical protein EJ06DRAFT_532048 [Trichodelitschia bisporula]|uniref:Cytochrome oxidase c assembly-domain-containing protein n=1 Tax=Trichodelitschia bisporula TaxID=703511 RepID=A0A6G1HR29_9PEZI|nr:hypothetical protein EJ06DRAFT_532048 [Trichodelitschia bisporula]